MLKSLSCGEALVDLLSAYGFDTVFGIPGTHAVELYRGLQNGKMRHILTRHEQGAGFMADGYARISGRPGLCFLITGPGLTNASTAIAQAYSDSVPMLIITPVNESWSLGKNWGRLHETTNQRALSAPITGGGSTAETPESLPLLVHEAMALFHNQRPRPVHIEIPLDILAQKDVGEWSTVQLENKQKPDTGLLDQAIDILKQAQNPAIIIGGGAKSAGSSIGWIAEALSATVITTIAAKGAVPDSHPLSLGSSLAAPETQNYLNTCDVVLVLGSDLGQTDIWNDDFSFSGKLIRVDIDPSELKDNFAPDLAIQGDAKQAVEYIAASIIDQKNSSLRAGKLAAIEACRTALLASLSDKQQAHLTFLNALRRALPENAIVVGDMAQVVYTANHFMPFEQPNCYLQPTGYGTLGYALPAALGAKLAAPDRVVVALAGDYGAMFTIQEMATAIQDNIPVVLIVWNNAALAQIRDDMNDAGVAPVGVEATPPDCCALARAFGWSAVSLKSADAAQETIREAIDSGKPTLIEVSEDLFL